MPSAGILTRPTLRWAAAQASARFRLMAGQSGKMVTHAMIHDREHIQRLPAVPGQVPVQPVVEAAKERRGH
jgi:hypothetical protein